MDGEGEVVNWVDGTGAEVNGAEDGRSEVHISGREEMNYSGDKHWRGKGRTESGHNPSEEEMLLTVQSSSPKRHKKNQKGKERGEVTREDGRTERGPHSQNQYNHRRIPLLAGAKNGRNQQDRNPEHQWPVVAHQNSDARGIYKNTTARHHTLIGSNSAHVIHDTRI